MNHFLFFIGGCIVGGVLSRIAFKIWVKKQVN